MKGLDRILTLCRFNKENKIFNFLMETSGVV